MAVPDRSFAPPAHMLATAQVLPGPGVTAAPSGGQGFALDPGGTIPASLLTAGALVPAVSLGSDTNSTGTTRSIKARGALIPWQEMVTLGKALQVRLVGAIVAGASSTLVASVVVSSAALGGASTDDTNEFASISTASTSDVTSDSGWTTIDTSLVAVTAYVAVNLSIKRTGSNNGTARASTTIFYQWA